MAKFEDMLAKAQARAKSSKKNKEPFVIEIEGETYSIDYPDAQAYLEMSTLDESEVLQQMKVVFRNNPRAFNALMRSLAGQPAEVIEVVLDEMFAFWNDDSMAQPGKSKA